MKKYKSYTQNNTVLQIYSEREMFISWHCKLLKLHSIGDERMIMENR